MALFEKLNNLKEKSNTDIKDSIIGIKELYYKNKLAFIIVCVIWVCLGLIIVLIILYLISLN